MVFVLIIIKLELFHFEIEFTNCLQSVENIVITTSSTFYTCQPMAFPMAFTSLKWTPLAMPSMRLDILFCGFTLTCILDSLFRRSLVGTISLVWIAWWSRNVYHSGWNACIKFCRSWSFVIICGKWNVQKSSNF